MVKQHQFCDVTSPSNGLSFEGLEQIRLQMMLGLWPKALSEWCCSTWNLVSVFVEKLKTDYLEHQGEMTSFFSVLERDDTKTSKLVINKNNRNPVSEPLPFQA